MTTVYTKNQCQQCIATKRLLNKLEIPFEEINVDEDDTYLAYIKELGFQAAPVVVSGNQSWSGFNPGAIKALAK